MGLKVESGDMVRRTGDTMSGALYITDGVDTLHLPATGIETTNVELTLGSDSGGTAGALSVICSATGVCFVLSTTEVAATAQNGSIYVDSVDGKLYFKDAGGVAHALY